MRVLPLGISCDGVGAYPARVALLNEMSVNGLARASVFRSGDRLIFRQVLGVNVIDLARVIANL
jgi:hypothetical protein